ncbi:GH12909 [Drosophila grimshawi]|uniref:GH12909 n=1 Tax=Drosophila grimshawi TaxID=7222 RepID=B4JIS6_DROGR|nr:GH12909 [Drosophila grimshawi]
MYVCLCPLLDQTKRRARAGGKDPSDAVELDRKNVSFELPDELFSKSFSTITQTSQALSRLIMNSARRYSRFILFFKPMFGDALVVKGYEDPTTTTTTTRRPTKSANDGGDRLNEV